MTDSHQIALAIDSAPLRTTASLALVDPRRRKIATEELAQWIADQLNAPPPRDYRQMSLPL